MKKYIISLLTVCTFGVYILYQKVGGSPVAIVPKDQPLSMTSDVPSNTSSGGNGVYGGVTVNTQSSATPVEIPTPKKTVQPPPVAVKKQGKYKDGQYTGDSADAYYGNVQVEAVIKNGSLSNVVVLDHPQDRSRSVAINTRAMPILVREAIQVQSANVDAVSGATDSSGAFKQSLSSALVQAIN